MHSTSFLLAAIFERLCLFYKDVNYSVLFFSVILQISISLVCIHTMSVFVRFVIQNRYISVKNPISPCWILIIVL